jgi:ketosteroid isomerase-like protein
MVKRLLAVIFFLTLSLAGHAQSARSEPGSAVPDTALMQKLLDGWSTLNPDNVAAHYPSGPHMYFDIAPLKYNNWQEYSEGVKKLGANYETFKMTLNDDAQVHHQGDVAWGTATIKQEDTLQDGKREMATFRWTVIWQKQEGKWMIVHEHTSVSTQ